jgi:uncharacterized protein YutE (UPF0331/DUF86 family)
MSPGKLDDQTVRRHLASLQMALSQLRGHAGRTLALLQTDLDELWTVERGLQLCAQNALDIATHIAASAGRDVPDYASAFDALSAIGVLDPDFVARFRAIAGFRNLLVHGYIEVDVPRVHQLLNQRLDDFAEFAAKITDYVSAILRS